MSEFQIAADFRLSSGEAARDYLIDMIKQLANLARSSDETHLAIILEAAVAVDRFGRDRAGSGRVDAI